MINCLSRVSRTYMSHSQACHPLSSFPHARSRLAASPPSTATEALQLTLLFLSAPFTSSCPFSLYRHSAPHRELPTLMFHLFTKVYVCLTRRRSSCSKKNLKNNKNLRVFTTERRGMWNWCFWTPFADDFVFVVFNWFPLLCQWKKTKENRHSLHNLLVHYVLQMCD